ncbi:hypothetical protein P170DRAFT_457028 [Aspergillus steynii IBT 23096]|uniref:RING-type domain-containing protein n=1 Tax=Aspergillus steynii IBT 23096 TaxID=1392250 RepID=A0A2I2G6T4_9EURO|nr:uncharacterized protein P170DRAFT_457028 [Aspergillus steynii IBT 23096]PLB48582.1 hypothetical protein P170DRAFT_457028 [Aspergillus steynii IBT 23096]
MSSPSSTTSSPNPTNSDHGGNDNGSSPTSSPLLFFVALGFGVVFTNLWIIVGVKYCFRYNQRNRQLRNEETGEPIDLVAIPRPHRRRREKKLMTMDEVNDRFPLIKYKAWRSSRANDGLPTAGGISPWNNTPESLKDGDVKLSVTAEVPDSTPAPQENHPDLSVSQPALAGLAELKQPRQEEKAERDLSFTEQETPNLGTEPNVVDGRNPGYDHTSEYRGHDIDNQICTSAPVELLPDPGDSCAICLDVIEDDDDIRGLTCGHAFHASCVDPWLTCRKACCPLCKADYYIPKSRSDPTVPTANSERVSRRTASRAPVINPPEAVFIGGRMSASRGGFSLTNRQHLPSRANQSNSTMRSFWPWQGSHSQVGGLPSETASNQQERRNWRQRLISPRSFQFPAFSMPSRRNAVREDRTLGELESGSPIKRL